MKPISGPEWDNSEYPSLSSPELAKDLDRVRELIAKLEEISAGISPRVARADSLDEAEERAAIEAARRSAALEEEASRILWSAGSFGYCEVSVDGRDSAAQKLVAETQALSARLDQATQPARQFLLRARPEAVEEYLRDPRIAPERFMIRNGRKKRDELLSLEEETLLSAFGVDGHSSWGNLHGMISGKLSCEVDTGGRTERIGAAKASSLLMGPDEKIRRSAWEGIGKAWAAHADTCAAALNALAGWRLEECRRRSRKRPVRFLDGPLHDSRILRETLEAMHGAIASEADIGRKALKLMARGLGKASLDPWDLHAPAPTQGPGRLFPFEEGFSIVREVFGSIDPKMAEFADTMLANRWIEGRVNDFKRPGAYCTGFGKSRTPRVYMTYTGTAGNVSTLAHEMGHAFHSWVMRDMPLSEIHYPMTLAETASIFAENALAASLFERARGSDEILPVVWGEARDAAAYLVNIPSRFDFEKSVHEARANGQLSVEELGALNDESQRRHYGDALSRPDSTFWMSKLHFYLARVPFYNFPYTFGYLFSLGVYAQRAKLGAKFFDAYVALLRDTGRMTAEEVAAKHLGADLTKPDFWKESLSIARAKVDRLERALP